VRNAFLVKSVFAIIIWPAPLDRDRCHFLCQAQHSEPIVTADARPPRADARPPRADHGRVRAPGHSAHSAHPPIEVMRLYARKGIVITL
jgi:hypothetical protein